MTESNSIQDATRPAEPLRVRYRVRFAKQGLLRWISHRDLARLWERIARRVDLPLSMTEGFHPKPRIAFPSALALGIESLDEVVELELTEELAASDLLLRLQGDQQPGLVIHAVDRLPDGFGKARLLRSDYSVTLIPDADLDALQKAIERLLATEQVIVDRGTKTLRVDVAEQLPRLELGRQELWFSLAASDAASLKPTDVLELLGIGDWVERGAQIVRTRVALQKEVAGDGSAEDPSRDSHQARSGDAS